MKAAAAEQSEFPWDRVMAMGFGLLRLSPKTFWSMTPREFERALSALSPGRSDAPRRNDLASLMRAFPDKTLQEEAWPKT
ncbi:phage tail assembly chaperone [Mesorhizobium sp. CGMCC 1.15528]|uniref:Phage tail assembly chaperone n=1 Tax=Mesorhizobium zhangyense TaxID=1776730 RepID=A0A7C9VB58_9HYPH|nr:rcc01693 family protein [Mesorhizobium zhangyense]NGN40611.1 phage tail assembly chaperone [Mesorhizobium zhangyense]